MADGDEEVDPVARLEEAERELELARHKADYYRDLAQQAGSRRLRETETLSRLIERVRSTERELEVARDQLEQRVEERTAELKAANDELAREVAERERMAARLRASEEQFRSFMRHFPGLAYIKDSEMTCTFANEAFRTLLGIDPDWAVGRSNEELFPGEFGEKITREDLELLESGDSVRIEEHFAGRVWVTYKFVIPSPGGEPRLGGLTLDVTEVERAARERRQLERQLQQQQKLESLGVLAGGIAHDFNNLLTAILGNIGLAQSEVAAASLAGSCLEDAEAATRSAAELCRQMLAYSGRGRFVVEDLDLNELIGGTVKLIRSSISKRAALDLRLGEAVGRVRGDPIQLRQVVMNLVINASEAIGDDDGVISVVTGMAMVGPEGTTARNLVLGESLPHGHYAWLEVTDSGCGMAEATQQRIFEPFFSTKFTGRGLGLSAVLGIVRGLAGAIEVDSVPEQGTRIRVWLPIIEEPQSVELEAFQAAEDWKGEGIVLVVDDEEHVRRVAKRLLKQLGFDVVLARDGREAVTIYERDGDRIRLVLLDLTMPQLDGVETLRKLRALDPVASVLVASGYSETEVAGRFADGAPNGFVEKPFDLESLGAGLKAVLEGDVSAGG